MSSLLQQAMTRVNDAATEPKVYTCAYCKDTGFMAMDIKRQYHPLTDLMGSQVVSVLPCKCKLNEDIKKRMKYSGIDLIEYEKKSFETFKRDTEENTKMYELAQRFVANYDTAGGCGYFGKSGTGKTHICIAICNALAQKCISHRYFSYRKEIHLLKALAYKNEEYEKKFNDFANTSVLYIDDLFKLARTNRGDLDMQELQIIYDLINYRYINNKKIIISSEYTVSEIKDIDEATGSRLFEMIGEYGMKVESKNRRFVNVGGK